MREARVRDGLARRVLLALGPWSLSLFPPSLPALKFVFFLSFSPSFILSDTHKHTQTHTHTRTHARTHTHTHTHHTRTHTHTHTHRRAREEHRLEWVLHIDGDELFYTPSMHVASHFRRLSREADQRNIWQVLPPLCVPKPETLNPKP